MNNLLIVGFDDKTDFILSQLDFSQPTLIVDDGPLLDALELPSTRLDFSQSREIVRLDWTRHHLNPLQHIDYLQACDLLAAFQATFPAGQNTLTKEGAWDWLLEAFLGAAKGERLDKLFRAKFDDPGYVSAQRMVRRLMRSPLLKQVLCAPTNFPMDAVVLARISRATLGDFDSFVLGNLLINQFQGQVIVIDGGFYLRDHHIRLIRQGRLFLCVDYLEQLSPSLREAALGIRDKVAFRTSQNDADILKLYFRSVLNPDILAYQTDGAYRVSWGE